MVPATRRGPDLSFTYLQSGPAGTFEAGPKRPDGFQGLQPADLPYEDGHGLRRGGALPLPRPDEAKGGRKAFSHRKRAGPTPLKRERQGRAEGPSCSVVYRGVVTLPRVLW